VGFRNIEQLVYENVTKRLLKENEIVRKKADKEMIMRIDGFEKVVRDTAKTLLLEELDKRIREIVKEELRK